MVAVSLDKEEGVEVRSAYRVRVDVRANDEVVFDTLSVRTRRRRDCVDIVVVVVPRLLRRSFLEVLRLALGADWVRLCDSCCSSSSCCCCSPFDSWLLFFEDDPFFRLLRLSDLRLLSLLLRFFPGTGDVVVWRFFVLLDDDPLRFLLLDVDVLACRSLAVTGIDCCFRTND